MEFINPECICQKTVDFNVQESTAKYELMGLLIKYKNIYMP